MTVEAKTLTTIVSGGNGTKPELGNIYQRINAALVEMGDLSTDKVHPHHKFPYVSVGKLLAEWRHVSVKYGIRTSMSFASADMLELRFINVENPDDRESSQWPLYAEDKGWSYTAKYALMKALMVADDEEPDERTVQTAPSRPSADWQPVANIPSSDPCPIETCTGSLVQRKGQYGDFVSCTNYKECGFKPVNGTIEEYRKGEDEFADVEAPEPALDDVAYIRSVWQKVTSDKRLEAFGAGQLAVCLSMNSKGVWALKPEGVEALKVAPEDRVRAVAACFKLQLND